MASLDARYGSLWCEQLLSSVADRAYEAVTGHAPPAAPDAEAAAATDSAGPIEDWDFDDPEQMRRWYPRLWARFGRD
jgi:hypothetical protein